MKSSNNLKWELNDVNIVKKAQQRLYFYRAFTELQLSVLISITVRFGSITQREMLRLNRVVKIGRDLPSIEILYQQRLLGRATLISQDSSHPAHDLFEPKPGPTALVLAFSP